MGADAGNIIPTIITAHIATKVEGSRPIVRSRPDIRIADPEWACLTTQIQESRAIAMRPAKTRLR